MTKTYSGSLSPNVTSFFFSSTSAFIEKLQLLLKCLTTPDQRRVCGKQGHTALLQSPSPTFSEIKGGQEAK